MTLAEANELIHLCQRIRHNASSIMVPENFNNTGVKPYKLSDLPTELALSHALAVIEKRIKNIQERDLPVIPNEQQS